MCNVDNILNGDYKKIFNSASNRYSIQRTGDIDSKLDSISKEVYNLIRGTSNEITYINSDIGGHIGNPTKEEYIRWMQLGTFEPIFRIHCTNSVARFREPWNYDEETLNISRKYINLRYRLLPLMYSKCFDNYFSGEPLFKELSFNYRDKKSRNIKHEYLLANDILISHFGKKPSKIISKNSYIGKVEAEYFTNPDLIGEPFYKESLNEVRLSLSHEPPVKGMSPYEFSIRYRFKLRFNKLTTLSVTSDDGCTVFVDGVKIHEDKSMHGLSSSSLGKFEANKLYDFVIEYYQHGGEAGIYLSTYDDLAIINRTYLPKDEWIDAFNGKIYSKNRMVSKDINVIDEMGLFIRGGSILPLVEEENRAMDFDYSKLYLDYYPSKNNEDYQTLYEDDKETTAYKLGNYRVTNISSKFDKTNNEMVISISKVKGNYNDEINFRNVILKYHLLKGMNKVKEVRINDEIVPFKIFKKDSSLMPLSATDSSRCEKTLVVKFKIDLSKNYVIRFKL